MVAHGVAHGSARRAAHPSYLIRRGATLVFRRRVPGSLEKICRKSFWAVSLRTHLLAEGRRRAAIAARFTDDLIGLVEAVGADMLEERHMDGVIDALIRMEIDLAEALRESAGPRTPDAVTAAIRVHEATRETLRAALVYNDYAAVEAPVARTLARLGLELDRTDESWPRLARRAARALCEVAEENIRREQGVYASDAHLPAALAAASAIAASAPATAPGAAPRAAATPAPMPPAKPAAQPAPARSAAPVPAPASDPAAPPSAPPSALSSAPSSAPSSAASCGASTDIATDPSSPASPAPSPAPSPAAPPVAPSAPVPGPDTPRAPAAQPPADPPATVPEATDPGSPRGDSSGAPVCPPRSPRRAAAACAPVAAPMDDPVAARAARVAKIRTYGPAESVDPETLTADSPFTAWFGAALFRKREENPNWDTNNLSNWKSTRKLVLEAYGDKPLSFFTKATLREFRSLLRALPATHHKSSDSPGLYTIIEEAELEEERAIAEAKAEIARLDLNRGDAEQRLAAARIKRNSAHTVYRHLQAIQFIFENAADHGAAPHNLLKGVMWTIKQKETLRAEEKTARRLPWGDALGDLLATSAFVMPMADGTDVHDVFWPTLLGVHAGLRQEEALQLRADDVDTIEGIPILRIQSGEGQHLKGGTEHRIVPLHDNLVALGFLRFVEERRRAGQVWLFPDINRCAAKGRLSGTFTKTFTRYRVAEGVYHPRRDFHSLRTHFNVSLKRRQCPLEIRKRLMGHKIRDVTEEHYDPEGSPIQEFKEWIDTIEIDISGIRSPWADAAGAMAGTADNVVQFAR